MKVHKSKLFETKDHLIYHEPYSISIMITTKDKTKLCSKIFIGWPEYKKGHALKIDLWPEMQQKIEIYPGVFGTIAFKNTINTIITKVKILKRKKQCFVNVKEL